MILSPDEKGEQSVSNILLISVQRVNEKLFKKKVVSALLYLSLESKVQDVFTFLCFWTS